MYYGIRIIYKVHITQKATEILPRFNFVDHIINKGRTPIFLFELTGIHLAFKLTSWTWHFQVYENYNATVANIGSD